MKLCALFISTVLPSLAVSKSLSFFGDQTVLDPTDDLKVPGNNPLTYCQVPTNDILAIESVDLSPNPPDAGQTLTIKASGIFSQDVEEGAKVRLQVKYGLIRLINQEADLCEQIKEVDLECPLKKGATNITKAVDIPKEIPPGVYHVLADVYTKDNAKITCLEASVTFGRKL